MVSKNRGKAKHNETTADKTERRGQGTISQEGTGKEKQTHCGNCSDSSDSDDSDIEEVIVDEDMHGTSIDFFKFNIERLHTVLPDIPWTLMHKMTSRIRGVN